MIGYSILAAEQTDGSYLCDKVSGFFGAEVNLLEKEDAPKEASRIHNLFGKDKNEFTLSKDELIAINKATTIIEGKEGYHPLACDAIVIIPSTKDKFLYIDKKTGEFNNRHK